MDYQKLDLHHRDQYFPMSSTISNHWLPLLGRPTPSIPHLPTYVMPIFSDFMGPLARRWPIPTPDNNQYGGMRCFSVSQPPQLCTIFI